MPGKSREALELLRRAAPKLTQTLAGAVGY